jgi:ring-1,2-phenylacetyl-CoA epoxidase subunit PaaC
MSNSKKMAIAYLLRIADGSLILAQRLSEWCGHGPVLEEDIAFTNIALDLLGQARLLYSLAGEREGRGRDEDALAYFRDEQDFTNPTLVELPNGDFGQSVLRTYLYAAYQQRLWQSLTAASDAELAAIAEKSAKETAYHCSHLSSWIIRLGDGTAESQARMQRALDYVWPYTQELFATDAIDPHANQLEREWLSTVTTVLTEATLMIPPATPFRATGKQGRHSEHMGYLLHEMQSLARAHPGAKW